MSNKVPFGEKSVKYFLGYEVKKVRPLFIILPRMNAYKRDFDETKFMFFLIKNDELLEKYNEIWDKVSKVIKKGFDSNPEYNDKYLKNKIKSYVRKTNTHFHDNKVPKKALKTFSYW